MRETCEAAIVAKDAPADRKSFPYPVKLRCIASRTFQGAYSRRTLSFPFSLLHKGPWAVREIRLFTAYKHVGFIHDFFVLFFFFAWAKFVAFWSHNNWIHTLFAPYGPLPQAITPPRLNVLWNKTTGPSPPSARKGVPPCHITMRMKPMPFSILLWSRAIALGLLEVPQRRCNTFLAHWEWNWWARINTHI